MLDDAELLPWEVDDYDTTAVREAHDAGSPAGCPENSPFASAFLGRLVLRRCLSKHAFVWKTMSSALRDKEGTFFTLTDLELKHYCSNYLFQGKNCNCF